MLADLWEWFDSLTWLEWRLVGATVAGIAVLTYVFWQVMVPMWVLAGSVAAFLRYSRPKNSL